VFLNWLDVHYHDECCVTGRFIWTAEWVGPRCTPAPALLRNDGRRAQAEIWRPVVAGHCRPTMCCHWSGHLTVSCLWRWMFDGNDVICYDLM